MPRLLTFLVILLALAGLAWFLASSADEVPQQVIETDVAAPPPAR